VAAMFSGALTSWSVGASSMHNESRLACSETALHAQQPGSACELSSASPTCNMVVAHLLTYLACCATMCVSCRHIRSAHLLQRRAVRPRHSHLHVRLRRSLGSSGVLRHCRSRIHWHVVAAAALRH
jgi:hypothetical protein